jgi:hypothetical protein
MATRQRKPDPERSILESRAAPTAAKLRGIVRDIKDPNDLAEAGWGVVRPRLRPIDPQAMQPLLELREQQAGDLFKVFDESSAPAPGEPAVKWIHRNGATLDVVDPYKAIPYFLLLVRSPESITFESQYTLDMYWAVGRLLFPEPDDALYAEASGRTKPHMS